MSLQKLRPVWALAIAFVFTALVWPAPAPDEEPSPDEIAAEPAKANEEEAAQNLKASENNLKQIGLAFYNYEATMAQLPRNITDKDGKALLSWRVQILPYIEQDNFYREFKLDEPWDSENNKKLIEKMPDLFASPRVTLKKKGFTVYQGFAGKGALFEPGVKLKFPSITDGTSNTIMVVETSKAVPWTKPVDMPFDAKKDLPDIGKAYGSKPLAAFCDGSVRTLNLMNIKPENLKAAITVAGGEILAADWMGE